MARITPASTFARDALYFFVYTMAAGVDNSSNGTFPVFVTPRDSSTPTGPLADESRTAAYIGMMFVF